MIKKFKNGILVDITQEELEAIQNARMVYESQKKNIPMSQGEVFDFLIKKLINSADISDEISLRMKTYYPEFEELIGSTLKAGFKLSYNNKLYKVRQQHTVQAIYPPSIETASLYEVIDEQHTGTEDDPIPYDQTMAVFNGKYYIFEEVVYLCIRDSGNPLYANPGDLLNNYFMLAADVMLNE